MTDRERTARSIAAAASSFGVITVLVYLIFVRTGVGQLLDASAFASGAPTGHLLLSVLKDGFRTGIVVVLATAALVAGVVAVRRGRWRTAGLALLLVIASVALARLLRWNLARPDLGDYAYRANTLPSGHTAAATSLVVAVAMLLPFRWRGRIMTTLAVVMIAAMGVASILTFAHRPSDVIAAILLVGMLGSPLLPAAGLNLRPRVRGPALMLLVFLSSAAVVLWTTQLLGGLSPSDLRFPLAPMTGVLAAALWVTLVLVGPQRPRPVTASAPRYPTPTSLVPPFQK